MGSHHGGAEPVEVEPMPGYFELISKASSAMLGAWSDCDACGLELSKKTLLDNANITWTEITLFFFCAFLWTQVRRGLSERLFKVGIISSNTTQADATVNLLTSLIMNRLIYLIRA